MRAICTSVEPTSASCRLKLPTLLRSVPFPLYRALQKIIKASSPFTCSLVEKEQDTGVHVVRAQARHTYSIVRTAVLGVEADPLQSAGSGVPWKNPAR